MNDSKSWERFIKSGKVNDYLHFVNSRKENEIIEGNREPFHDRSFSYKGNEDRGE